MRHVFCGKAAPYSVILLGALALAASCAHKGRPLRVRAVADIEPAIARVYPAIVRLAVVTEHAANGRMRKVSGFGSGVIIREDGHLVTNHHVAGHASRIICRLADGEEIEADIVGTDPLSDVTVVRLRMDRRQRNTPLVVATFGNSDALRVGQTVLAMGSPGGVTQVVTRGIVSNPSLILPGGAPSLDGEDVGSIVRWIAHDARIFAGNSGGPLVDLAGRIVGINEIVFAGIGGAIPGNLVRSVAETIMEHGEVRRSFIGLTVQPRPRGLGLECGALVASVLPDSPADEAGLRAGDVLLTFDGHPVNCAMPEDVPRFNILVLSTPIGQTVPVRFLREGEEQETRLTTSLREAARGHELEWRAWGMTARDLTRPSATATLRDSTDGVVVSSVQPGGPAAQADPPIRAGDVIVAVGGDAVLDLAELEAATAHLLEGHETAQPVLTAFERGRSRLLTVVRVGQPAQPDVPERTRRPDFPAILQAVTSALAEAMGLPDAGAIRVAYVFPGLSVAEAGLLTGDLITHFDGHPVRARTQADVMQFTRQVRARRAGATVPIEIQRDGAGLTLDLTLAEGEDAAHTERFSVDALDFTVRGLTLQERALQKLPDDLHGLLVDRVETASAAELGGLRVGDLLLSIGGRPTPNTVALGDFLKEPLPQFVLLLVRRGVNTLYIEVEPGAGSRPDRNATEGDDDPDSLERSI